MFLKKKNFFKILKKSQISSEILILIGVALILLIIAFYFYSDRNLEYQQQKEKVIANKIITTIARNVNTISSSTEGTSNTIFFPKTILGKEYHLNIRENILEINWNGNYLSYPLNTFNTIINTTQRSNYTIINLENTIYIGDFKECSLDRHCLSNQTCSNYICI